MPRLAATLALIASAVFCADSAGQLGPEIQDASGGGSKANLARESIDALCRDATLRPARSWPNASTLRSDPPPKLKIRLPNERAARRFLLNKQRLSCTSVVYIDESREHVLKVVFAYHEFHVAEREACFLRKLEPLDIAPRLLCEGQGALLTTYVGEQVSFHNLPADYREQLETMLRGMRELGGVRHNDLYKGLASKTVKTVGVLPMPKELAVELMVQGRKMRMVDFGWASTGGTNRSYACGTRVLEAVHSPFVPNSDERVVGVLDAMASLRARVGSDGKLRQHAPWQCKKKGGGGGGDGASAGKSKTLAKAASYQKYSDPTRSLGSQSEVPTLTDGKGGALVVRGYQKFIIKADGRLSFQDYMPKFNFLSELFAQLGRQKDRCSSLIDMGCNSGLTSLLARHNGFTEVHSLDHDPAYISLLRQVVSKRQMSGMHSRVFSFGEPLNVTADVVFVGALIHWVFCLTANFAGSFDNVLRYIFRLAARYVIIEWVEPVDSGICELHHIERCAGDAHMADRYTREGFVNALGKLGDIRATFDTISTRTLYVVQKRQGSLGGEEEWAKEMAKHRKQRC